MSESIVAARAPRTHMFAGRRGWGHDYTIHRVEDGGRVLHATGWKHGIREGDVMVLDAPHNADGRVHYCVRAIRYFDNPSDMWSATLDFVPRQVRVPA